MIEMNFETEIDFETKKNHLLLNSRFNLSEKNQLSELAESAIQKLNLNSHVVMATSGSTQEKNSSLKLVALSKQALLESAQAVNSFLKVTSIDVWGQVLPIHHVGGFGIEARSFLTNSKVVNLLNSKWDVQDFVKKLEMTRVSLTSLVPTQVFDIVKNNLKAPSYLRAVIVGGGSLSENLYVKARELGWPLLPSFGMTECSSQIATAELSSLNSKIYPKLKTLDHVQTSTDGGFLKIKSNSLFTAYIQKFENHIQIWDPKENAWFKTEDRVEINDGYLTPLGRHGDFIKIGAESTSLSRLREIFEKIILVNKADIHNFALSIRNSLRLENEIVLYSSQDLNTIQALVNQFNQQVLPFEKIRELIKVESIPLSDLGKIQYKRFDNETVN